MAFWERKSGKLRPFRLADSKGEVWTPAKVAGKTLIIHLWASYSAPSVMEMSLFKSLAERLAGSKDFQILSFNVDEDVNAFKEAIEGKSYPYPVIAAYYFVSEIVKFATVPRTWIVDPDGVWQWERSGSDRDEKTFFADLGRRVALPQEPVAEAPAPVSAAGPAAASAPAAESTASAAEPAAAAAPAATEAAAAATPAIEEVAEPVGAEAAAPKRARKKKT
jgi:thiol-disulfide isomerase/thioredoxin